VTILYTVLGIVALLVLLLYVGAPLLVRFSMQLKARPTILPIDVPHMPPEVYGYFGGTAPALTACGFNIASYVYIPDQVPNVTAYIALWVNPFAGQMATAVVVYPSAAPSAGPRAKIYVEFLTKLADGMAILTNNSGDLGAFKKSAQKDTLRAARVQDPGMLYHIHRNREARLANSGARRYLPEPGREAVAFVEAVAWDTRKQLTTGYFYEAEPDVLRPTLLGALLMTWGELPPFKQIRLARSDREAEREMRQAMEGPPPPPVRANVTHESPYRLPPGPG
jgi:hypothetical protein